MLIHHARRIAAGLNCTHLFAWLAANLLPRLALPADADVADLKICIPANRWSASSATPIATISCRPTRPPNMA